MNGCRRTRAPESEALEADKYIPFLVTRFYLRHALSWGFRLLYDLPLSLAWCSFSHPRFLRALVERGPRTENVDRFAQLITELGVKCLLVDRTQINRI